MWVIPVCWPAMLHLDSSSCFCLWMFGRLQLHVISSNSSARWRSASFCFVITSVDIVLIKGVTGQAHLWLCRILSCFRTSYCTRKNRFIHCNKLRWIFRNQYIHLHRLVNLHFIGILIQRSIYFLPAFLVMSTNQRFDYMFFSFPIPRIFPWTVALVLCSSKSSPSTRFPFF